jgi:hypothetical protein
MEASSMGKHQYGDQGRLVKYWVCLGCWSLPCCSTFSLVACFETYEQFISLSFRFFSGRGKSQVAEMADPELMDTGACLYFVFPFLLDRFLTIVNH